MDIVISHYQKYKARIKLRPLHKGQSVREGINNLDGEEVTIECIGLQGSSEKYPGEWMFGSGDEKSRLLFKSVNLYWIASGDVEIIEEYK